MKLFRRTWPSDVGEPLVQGQPVYNKDAASLSATPSSLPLALLMLSVVSLGTVNNFVGRIRAVTMGEYNSIVGGTLDAVMYCIFSFAGFTFMHFKGEPVIAESKYVLHWPGRSPLKIICLSAVSDQLGAICGMISQPYLTTLMYSLMNQACTPFAVVLSFLILHTRYVALEVFAVCLIVMAALMCVAGTNGDSGTNSFSMAVLCSTSTIFPAFAMVCKEVVFNGYYQFKAKPCQPKNLPDSLNVFVLSAVGSVISLVTALPLVVVTQYMSSDDPISTIRAGYNHLFTANYALTSYFAYIGVNTCFNLAIYMLVAEGSALMMFLSLKLVVPCTALASPLPWPIIGPRPFDKTLGSILFAMVTGIALFRIGNIQRDKLWAYQPCLFPLIKKLDLRMPSERSKTHGLDTPCKSPAPRLGHSRTL